MPEVELEVSEPLVQRLLDGLPEPLRDLRDEPLTRVAQGWDNSVWRVGERYAVRIPTRSVAAPIVARAARWLGEVSAPLREHGIRVPVPLHAGAAGPEVPWPWFLVEWVPGRLASELPVGERGTVGAALAGALPAMHRPAPPGAPASPARGVPLGERRAFLERHEPAARAHLGDSLMDALLAVVSEGVAAPTWPHQPVWCHGDLHAANLTLDADGTVGVLDFDDLTSGDPAVDLRFLWLVLDEAQREESRETLEASGAYDPGIWVRARGWAASSFVIPVAADPQGRVAFADAVEHAVTQLLG